MRFIRKSWNWARIMSRGILHLIRVVQCLRHRDSSRRAEPFMSGALGVQLKGTAACGFFGLLGPVTKRSEDQA
jgi:hypothetical protein